MSEAGAVAILERSASLEEDEVGVAVLSPSWRNEAFSITFGMLFLSASCAGSLVYAVYSFRSADYKSATFAAFISLGLLFFSVIAIRSAASLLPSRPRISMTDGPRGLVYTISMPVARHWVLEDDENRGRPWHLIESVAGLTVGLVQPRTINAGVSGARVEFDMYVSRDYGAYNGVVLVAMRFAEERGAPESLTQDRLPAAVYWLSDHRVRQPRRSEQSPQVIGLIAHDLLNDLLHAVSSDRIKPEVRSLVRETIDLTDLRPA